MCNAASETKLKKTQESLVRQPRQTHVKQLEKLNLEPPHSYRRSAESNPERLQQQKMEVVGQLATSIAHDIKNLLTVISGNLEMLAHDRAHEAQERCILVAEATRVTDLMSQLVSNLLAFVRKEQLDRELTDVGELAKSTVHFLKRIIGNGIGLQIQAGKSLNAKINPPQFHLAWCPAFLHRVPEAGAARYPDRRANDSHTPPPISATPDSRPSHRAGARFRNNLRLAPAAIAQPASVTAAIATEMMHITAS